MLQLSKEDWQELKILGDREGESDAASSLRTELTRGKDDTLLWESFEPRATPREREYEEVEGEEKEKEEEEE